MTKKSILFFSFLFFSAILTTIRSDHLVYRVSQIRRRLATETRLSLSMHRRPTRRPLTLRHSLPLLLLINFYNLIHFPLSTMPPPLALLINMFCSALALTIISHPMFHSRRNSHLHRHLNRRVPLLNPRWSILWQSALTLFPSQTLSPRCTSNCSRG